MKDYEISDLVQDAPAQAGEKQHYKGIVGRISDIVKSKYGKIATGLATGLLAAGLYTANPAKAGDLNADKFDLEVAYQDNGKKGVKLPDLGGLEPVGKQRVDELDLPGKESIMEGYNVGNKQVLLYKLNDKVYCFSVKHPDGSKITCADETHDGYFEQISKGSLDPKVDFDSYLKR